MNEENRGKKSGPEMSEEQVVEFLANMFGEVIERAVIAAIVESYGGDLTKSTEALMQMAEDNETASAMSKMESSEVVAPFPTAPTPPMSYSQVATTPKTMTEDSTSAIQKVKKPKDITDDTTFVKEQIERIISYHNKGCCVLILMRGPAGCGKTYTANLIVEATVGLNSNYKHLYSADDFFNTAYGYKFQPTEIGAVHEKNQRAVAKAIEARISPIIVDNTNTQLWEMDPYVRMGVNGGYYIEIVQPQTSWFNNTTELLRRNIHRVPFCSIRRMILRFEPLADANEFLKLLNLSYSPVKMPPTMRMYPKVITNTNTDECIQKLESIEIGMVNKVEVRANESIQKLESIEIGMINKVEVGANECIQESDSIETSMDNKVEVVANECIKEKDSIETNMCNKLKLDANEFIQESESIETSIYTKVEVNVNECIQESESVETISGIVTQTKEVELSQIWDMNGIWDQKPKKNTENSNLLNNQPKPKREGLTSKEEISKKEENTKREDSTDDWSLINYMDALKVDIPVETPKPEPLVSKESTGTQVLPSKKEAQSAIAILNATSRDINFNYIPMEDKSFPEIFMLDKSTSTIDYFVDDKIQCPNSENHFIALRSMFKKVAREDLREVFDKCYGDANWAFAIIKEAINLGNIECHDEEFSDCEDIEQEACNCISRYNVIPDINAAIKELDTKYLNSSKTDTPQQLPLKQVRQSKSKQVLTEKQLELKKQLEERVVISNTCYSPHTLRLKNLRSGQTQSPVSHAMSISPDSPNAQTDLSDSASASTDQSYDNQDFHQESTSSSYEYSSQDDDDSVAGIEPQYGASGDNVPDTMDENKTIVIGFEFISHLNKLFGRNANYTEEVLPMITAPLSLLAQLDALWTESLNHQMASQLDSYDIMLKEDEEFARRLAAEELALASEGREPEVPNFKEIMDMDFALSIYKQDVEMWKTQEPDDWATRMSKDKLYSLFPELPEDTLSQILMSQNYNFQKTVEMVLTTTGREDIVRNGGAKKFIADNEMARQKRMLDEELKKAKEREAEVTFFDPEFNQANGEITMETIDEFRGQAQVCLALRNDCLQKAQASITYRNTYAATYYYQVARLHRKRFETANNLAASTIMQYHNQTKGQSTLDLHFLYVPEALQAVDMFLDQSIARKKLNPNENGAKYIITGRGIHSPAAQPKIKPAVMRRLTARGIPYVKVNPGVVMVKIKGNELLSHELPQNSKRRNQF